MTDDERVTDGEAVALLEEMVGIPSLSGQEGVLAAQIARAMGDLGFGAEVDGAGNAVGHIGDGPRHIALVGHMDTVPGEVPVRREGDLLYGRGAVDAKGPLAAFIVAAARAGRVADLRISVMGAVEEEAATSKGARHVSGRMRPDYAVIGEPSGWSRVTIGYKGRLLIDYALTQPAAHSAGEARGAPEEALAFWQRVADWAEEANRDIEGRFATVDPSLRAIRSSSDGLAERVEMTIGLRLPLGLDVDGLLAQIEAWRGEAEVTTRGREAAYRAEKRTPLAAAFLAAIRAEGERPAFVTKTGTSDMNVLGPLWGCPMVAYGPGDSSLDHTPDEHIDLREYLRSIRVLEGVLGRLGERP